MNVRKIALNVWEVIDDGDEYYVYYNLKDKLVCTCRRYANTGVCKHVLYISRQVMLHDRRVDKAKGNR